MRLRSPAFNTKLHVDLIEPLRWTSWAGRAVPSTVRGSPALFTPQLPNGAHARGTAHFYSKLSHFINQRSTRQSKTIGRPVLPSDHPGGLLQGLQDMLP